MSSSCPADGPRDRAGAPRRSVMHAARGVRGEMESVSEPSKTPARPPQVTAAAWMIMVGSVFVVLMVWDRIAGLHSLDTRKALESFLDEPRVKDSGLQLGDLLAVIRIGSMIAAGCATAMAILGYQTLQRSRGARLALTLLAVPLFISGLATGGYLTSAVAAAVGTLWLRPARLWFDGKVVPTAGGAASATPSQTRPVWPPPYDPGRPPEPGPASPDQPPVDQARPQPGCPPATPSQWAPLPSSRYGVPSPVASGATGARPPTLVWACVLTWIFSSLAAVVCVTSIVVLAQDSGVILDKMHDQNPDLAARGVSDHLILVVCFVTCAVMAVWSVGAAVLAVLAFRRKRLALYGLIASAAAASLFCLLGALGSLVVLVPLGAAAATIGCLVRPEVKAWFD